MADEKEYIIKVFEESDIRMAANRLETDEGIIKLVDSNDSVIGIFSIRNIIGIYEKEKSDIREVGFTP